MEEELSAYKSNLQSQEISLKKNKELLLEKNIAFQDIELKLASEK